MIMIMVKGRVFFRLTCSKTFLSLIKLLQQSEVAGNFGAHFGVGNGV